MTKRTGPTNYQLQQLLHELKVKAVTSRFWKRIVEDLEKPTRQRRIVNVYTIDQVAQNGETIIVPGKVLSLGNLSKKVNVAAFQCSSEARQKIAHANGRVLTITELIKENPQGKNEIGRAH